MIKPFAVAAVAAACLAHAAPTAAAELAPKGAKALLEISIEVDGKADFNGKFGEYQHWRARRSVVVRAILVAVQPTADDPGDPGQPPPAAAAATAAPQFQPSADTEAMMAAMEKCGEDTACQMRLAQKMMQNAGVQADMQRVQKGAKAAEASAKRPPRYQMWMPDSRFPATGTVKVEENLDQLFKTAVDEKTTCKAHGDFKYEEVFQRTAFPATIKIDAEAGTYAASFGVNLGVFATNDCVRLDGRQRSESHDQLLVNLLPEITDGAKGRTIQARGGADAAKSGRRLAHGDATLAGSDGKLSGGVPKTVKLTVRWTLTRKD